MLTKVNSFEKSLPFYRRKYEKHNNKDFSFAQQTFYSQNYVSALKAYTPISFSGQNYNRIIKNIADFDKSGGTPIITSIKPDFIKKITQKLQQKNTPFIIGITGESGSGKTTLSRAVTNILKENNISTSFISTDMYYKDLSALFKKYGNYSNILKAGIECEGPKWFHLDTLVNDVNQLASGNEVKIPNFNFITGETTPTAATVKPSKILIVEGIASLYKDTHKIYDASVFVDTPSIVRSERFYKRAPERGFTDEETKTLLEYVLKLGKKYVAPSRDKADIVISGVNDKNKMNSLISYIFEAFTNNHQKKPAY